MKISENKVATIHYTLTDSQGEELDSSIGEDPLEYLHGHQNIIPGLEDALENKEKGYKSKISVAPENGYGERVEKLVNEVPLDKFQNQDQIQPGVQFEVEIEGALNLATVTKIENELVTVDLNHPLAGETLNFDLEVISVRDASEEEINQGHPHS